MKHMCCSNINNTAVFILITGMHVIDMLFLYVCVSNMRLFVEAGVRVALVIYRVPCSDFFFPRLFVLIV